MCDRLPRLVALQHDDGHHDDDEDADTAQGDAYSAANLAACCC